MPNCQSCGVPFSEHLGLQGTCAELVALRTKIKELRDEWDEARADFAKGLPTESGREHDENYGWWDACCCVVKDFEELLGEEAENG